MTWYLLTTDNRVKQHFGPASLDGTAINTTYSHVLNPMVVTRSYMCVEPIALYLNTKALRRGIVQLTDPESDPYCLLVHDSGMVPVCTQIAIVNPETCMLSRIGEFGERRGILGNPSVISATFQRARAGAPQTRSEASARPPPVHVRRGRAGVRCF